MATTSLERSYTYIEYPKVYILQAVRNFTASISTELEQKISTELSIFIYILQWYFTTYKISNREWFEKKTGFELFVDHRFMIEIFRYTSSTCFISFHFRIELVDGDELAVGAELESCNPKIQNCSSPILDTPKLEGLSTAAR